MALSEIDAALKAARYLRPDSLEDNLGDGADGHVFTTSRRSAVKVFEHRSKFDRELAAYERLTEHQVLSVAGFKVPTYYGSDADLLVIEMGIVRPPFLIDFAATSVDYDIFDEDVMNQKWAELADIFDDRIEVVQDVYRELIVKYGIYYYDFSPKNLRFE